MLSKFFEKEKRVFDKYTDFDNLSLKSIKIITVFYIVMFLSAIIGLLLV